MPNLHLHPPAARLSPRDTVLSCPEPSAVLPSASFWPRLHSRPAFKGYFTSKTEKVHTVSVPKRNDPENDAAWEELAIRGRSSRKADFGGL